jgi:hypothetical protein
MIDPMVPTLRHALAALLLLTLAAAPRAGAQEAADPVVRAVLAFQLTLPRAEAYVAALRDLEALGRQSPEVLAPFRGTRPKANAITLEEAASMLEKVPAIKEILDRRALRATDFVVLPIAMKQAQVVAQGWSKGRNFPGGKVNLGNAEAWKADPAAWEKLAAEAASLRKQVFGT